MNETLGSRFKTTIELNIELVEKIRIAYEESNEEVDRLLKVAIEFKESFINGS